MKIYIFIILITLFVYSCNDNCKTNQLADQIDTTILGIYNSGYGELRENLNLFDDSTFIYEEYWYSDYIQKGYPSSKVIKINGDYLKEQNTIILNPVHYLKQDIYEDTVKTLIDENYYFSDSTKIKTKFYIIKWSENVYLLSEENTNESGLYFENDFIRFANSYNSGSEPNYSELYFVKRVNKKRFGKIDITQIPEKYVSYFLDTFIEVKIVKIEKDVFFDSLLHTSINKIVLNRGKENGILEGMEFYSGGCCNIRIIEVSENTSTGIIELCPYHQDACQVGFLLTSWNSKDYGKYAP